MVIVYCVVLPVHVSSFIANFEFSSFIFRPSSRTGYNVAWSETWHRGLRERWRQF